MTQVQGIIIIGLQKEGCSSCPGWPPLPKQQGTVSLKTSEKEATFLPDKSDSKL